jgi:hypothetical protein
MLDWRSNIKFIEGIQQDVDFEKGKPGNLIFSD